MTKERIDDLIALAALGELNDRDQRELDAAAIDDPTVAADLAQALSAAAVLQATTAQPPPPALRDSVLAAIRSTPQEPASTPADSVHDVESGAAVVSLDAERHRRRWMTAALGAVAAIVLLVGGIVAVSSSRSSPSGEIAAIVEAPDVETRSLDGELVGVTVAYSATEQALVIEGSNVSALDESETYQLWLVDDAGATSVGVFRPDPEGQIAERFDDVDPTGFVLGVTREPAGGSEAPTLPILASA